MTEPTPEPNVSPPPVAEQPLADPIEAKLTEVSAPFVTPIPGSDAAGENARHDERHEAIRNEIDKLGRPEAEELDWALIESAGRALLTEKSKDYLIASYFGVAAYVRAGPRGLIEGICAISALLEHYWDSGFPPPNRLRARINAIDWFLEKVGAFGDRAAKTVHRDDFQMLSQATKKFQSLVLDRFQDDIPNIYGLKETLERVELSIAAQSDGEPQAQADPSAQPAAVDPSPAQQSATSVSPAPSLGGASVAPPPPGGSAEAKLAELAQPFINPIPGGARAGENARHDEKHQAVRNEVDKLGKPTAEEVDWGLVCDAGRELLTTTSKDFLIASYFGVASYVRGGVEGLVTGLAALSALLRDYWDDGFPPSARVHARVNAIDWFIDRVESMGDLAPKTADEGDLQVLSLAAKQFETLVLDRFQDESPNIYRLKQTLERIELAVAKQAPAQPGAAAQSATAGPAATPTQTTPEREQPMPAATVQLATPTAQLTDPAQVNKFLREVGESIHKASRALFKASKEDPLAYRLCRQGLYMSFQQAPPAANGNQTMVPAPPPDREAHLNTLLSAQNWPVLLDEAESGLASARLLLDQHRYVALALAGLGHEKARETVVAETAAVVQRLPELPERAFSDGSPFASPATREWLSSLSPSATGSGAFGGAAGGETGAFEEGLAEAHKLALGGKLGEAVERLNGAIDSGATSGRDRFRAKLAMANACLAAGSPALAEGILAGLSDETQRFRLQEWEPKMAEACYRSRYEALAAMAGESAKSRDELVDVYRQLCGVAPAEALKLGKPPGGRG
jgi:type VI secretion system protein VasJ